MRSVVIIPAFNEAESIGKVIRDIPRNVADEVIVVDNGSTDGTGDVARAAGATVIHEPRQGYGQACLAGISRACSSRPDVIVFLDGDYSDYPEEMSMVVQPILNDGADLVIGSRVLGRRERGALLPQALIGNWIACTLMRLIWGARFTDLGPFRAVRFDALERLNMQDENYGWTIEMQIKAVRQGLRCVEVPVSYRKRIGASKVTGTLSGTIKASAKILWTIAKLALTQGSSRNPSNKLP